MTSLYGHAFLLCLLSVDYGWPEFCPLEAYFFQDDAICIWLTKTNESDKDSAQSCSQDGGSLIAIDNAGLHSFITHNFLSVAYLYWISDVDPDNSLSGCSALQPTEPPTAVSAECSEPLKGICFKPLECPHTALYIHETDTCYWINNTRQPAWIAQKSCESRNGSLAVIPTPTVMKYITDNYKTEMLEALATSGSDGLWIGYNDCAEEDVFRTFDGQLATWFSWLQKQPNDAVQLDDQDCVIMTAQGFEAWEDKACEKPRIALCYRTFNNENSTNTIGEDSCSPAISTVTTPIEMATTSITTTTIATLTGNISGNMCPVCYCGHAPNLLTPKELLEHLARLRLDTYIYYKNTSAYRRRHVSVYEPRIMAKCMGVTAGAVLVAVVLCLVILDLKSCRAKQRSPMNRLVRRI